MTQKEYTGQLAHYKGLQDAHTEAIAIMRREVEPCTWTRDYDMGDTYDSACGEKWSFIDGGPTENNVRFCHGCGKPVAIAKGAVNE